MWQLKLSCSLQLVGVGVAMDRRVISALIIFTLLLGGCPLPPFVNLRACAAPLRFRAESFPFPWGRMRLKRRAPTQRRPFRNFAKALSTCEHTCDTHGGPPMQKRQYIGHRPAFCVVSEEDLFVGKPYCRGFKKLRRPIHGGSFKGIGVTPVLWRRLLCLRIFWACSLGSAGPWIKRTQIGSDRLERIEGVGCLLAHHLRVSTSLKHQG